MYQVLSKVFDPKYLASRDGENQERVIKIMDI